MSLLVGLPGSVARASLAPTDGDVEGADDMSVSALAGTSLFTEPGVSVCAPGEEPSQHEDARFEARGRCTARNLSTNRAEGWIVPFRGHCA